MILLLFHITPCVSCEINGKQINGYIDNIVSPSSFKLMRERQKVEISVKTPIHEGDTIHIVTRDENAKIRLKLVNGMVRELPDNSVLMPYLVPLVNPSPTWQILLESTCDFIKSEVLGISSRERVTAISKKWLDLKIPLLAEAGMSKLKAGREVTHLTWIGGKAPYTVKLQQDKKQENSTGEIQISENDKNYSKITVVHLAKKLIGFKIKPNVPYKIDITDAKRKTVKLEDGSSERIFIKKEVNKDKCHLALAGGKAPYAITIQEKGRKPSWKQKKVCTDKGKIVCGNLIQFALSKEKHLQARNFSLKPRLRYFITVTDANKNQVTRKFAVVSESDIPKYSANGFEDIMELATHKKWRFESYQRVIEMINIDKELARHLKERLESGRGSLYDPVGK